MKVNIFFVLVVLVAIVTSSIATVKGCYGHKVLVVLYWLSINEHHLFALNAIETESVVIGLITYNIIKTQTTPRRQMMMIFKE